LWRVALLLLELFADILVAGLQVFAEFLRSLTGFLAGFPGIVQDLVHLVWAAR